MADVGRDIIDRLTEKPKPCRYCKQKFIDGTMMNDIRIIDAGCDLVYVRCDRCGAMGPDDISPELAVKKWNHGLTNQPTVVCLCGSTRFKTEYEEMGRREALAGRIVISCQLFQDGGQWDISEQMKKTIDELHKRKIDISDEILVIDRDGYVGESTRGEIEYAVEYGKRVRYMSKGE